MTETGRARATFEKLLKLARADVDTLRIDLCDVERARISAELSVSGLEETAQREEKLMRAHGRADFAAYFEGVRERRRNLQATMLALADAEAAARNRLKAAHIEIQKLEHLLGANAEAARKTASRRQRRAADQAAAASRRAS